MPRLDKGDHAALNVTQQARRRVFVGLAWDPNTKAGLLSAAREMIGGKKTWHDLDLSCFLYKADGSFIEAVTQAPDRAADASIHVYHSGDNREGRGDGDDEQISVELKNISPEIAHIVFMASIKSGHTFSEIDYPEIRLVDGYSNHIFHHAWLSAEEGQDSSAFVFVRLYRAGEMWRIHNIGEYLKAENDQNWPDFMKKYPVQG